MPRGDFDDTIAEYKQRFVRDPPSTRQEFSMNNFDWMSKRIDDVYAVLVKSK